MDKNQKTSEVEEVTKELVGWEDNRIVRTIRDLSVHPGVVIREFTEGEKQKYLSPVVYFFGVTAIETYVASITGLFDFIIQENVNSVSKSLADPALEAQGVDVTGIAEEMGSLYSALFSETGQKLLLLPVMLFLTWILYKGKGRGFKATSWFALYTLGHITLISMPLIVVWYFTGNLGLFTFLGLAIATVYWIWSSKQFFELTIGKAIALRLAGMAIMFGAFFVLQIVLMIVMIG